MSTEAYAAGSAAADSEENGLPKEECAAVKEWSNRVKEAREFDKPARSQYAADRKIIACDTREFDVEVPIAASYIEVLLSFAYAKNPDVACDPSSRTQPPPQKQMLELARNDAAGQLENDKQQAIQAGQKLGPVVAPLIESGAAAQILPAIAQMAQQSDPQAEIEQKARQGAADMAKPHQQLRQDAKQFAQTMELVIVSMWKAAHLKAQAKMGVRSALSIAVGWLKATWQERAEQDPTTQQAFYDLLDKMRGLQCKIEELAEGEVKDPDAAMQDIQAAMIGMARQGQKIVSRGMVIDFVPGEDIQVAPGGVLSNYAQAPWIAHKVMMQKDRAGATYKRVESMMDKAAVYYQRKPTDYKTRQQAGYVAPTDAPDAEMYTKEATASSSGTSGPENVCVWEIWDKEDGTVRTYIDGIDYWALEPYAPDPVTTRFYPFFLYQIGELDGVRHPKSLVTRTAQLFDEYNRARTGWKKARSRAIPKTIFNSAQVEVEEVKKVEGATEQEMVAMKLLDPDADVGTVFKEVVYAHIDPAVYDTGPIRAEIEMIWGVQEALSSSIHTAKTATESEIQQTGTNSRIGFNRDGLDDVLSELAEYTAEVAIQKIKPDEAEKIAGPNAFWPTGISLEDMRAMIEIDIRAGSTGKPNTSQKQQVWALILPQLQAAITQIASLRNSPPNEVADCIEELVKESLNRTGDRIDAERFLPEPADAGEPPPPPKGPPQPVADTAYQGQQVAALTQILDQTRQGILSPQSATAVIQATFPNIEPQLVQQMVAGVAQAAPPPPPQVPAAPAPQTVQ